MKKFVFVFALSTHQLINSSTVFAQANTYWHDRIDTTLFATADTTGHGANTYYATNTNTNFNVAKLMNGLTVNLFFKKGNTGSATLTLVTASGTLAKKTIRKSGGSTLSSGDIPDSTALILDYYNGNFRIVGVLVAATTDWHITGNSGTVTGTNFLGTTDTVSLMFKVHSINAGRLDWDKSYGTQSAFYGLYSGTNANNELGDVGVGNYALNQEVSGKFLIAVGTGAMHFHKHGDNVVAVGTDAMNIDTSGQNDVYVGFQSGSAAQNSADDVGVGTQTLHSNINGNDLTAVGHGAGFGTTGSYSTYLGSQAGGFGPGGNYDLMLGYQSGAHCTQNQHLHIGFQGYGSEDENDRFDLITGVFIYKDTSLQKVRVNSKLIIRTVPTYTTEADANAGESIKGTVVKINNGVIKYLYTTEFWDADLFDEEYLRW